MNNSFLPDGNTKRKLTEQQENFLHALSGEAKGNITKALEIAGYSLHQSLM